MNTYKVTFERLYPGAENDVRNAYVVAESFKEAESKVEKRWKDTYESAKVLSMERLDGEIIV